MGKRGRQSNVEVERLQITLTKEQIKHVDRAILLDGFGRNRNDAVSAIVDDWIKTRLSKELDDYLSLNRNAAEFDKIIKDKAGAPK